MSYSVVRWHGVRSGPRVSAAPDREGHLAVKIRLGQTVDQGLVDLINELAVTHMPALDTRPPLTYAEAAKALGVSKKWLSRRVNAAHKGGPPIPHTVLGKRVRFLPEHIREIRAERAEAAE